MPVPKRKQSKSRARRRRSHNGRRPMKLQDCAQCGHSVPSHVVCPNCGAYQGRPMVVPNDED